MSTMGRRILPNGQCYLCGCNLKAGTICFDCNDPAMTVRERTEKIFEIQKYQFETKGTCALKPEEGEDYFEMEEVIAYIGGSGAVRVWSDGDLDVDNIDCKKIEWDDIEISHTESTGHTKKVDKDGNPFDERRWLESQLTGVNRKTASPQSSAQMRPLYSFQSAEQSVTTQ